MPTLDLEAEYNNRQRVPEHPQINARWSAAHTRLGVACFARVICRGSPAGRSSAPSGKR